MEGQKNSEKPNQLKRSLGLWSTTAINVGAIIGGGIFVVTGIVASYAGSAMIISTIIAAIIALFTALTFSELSSWQPVEGSAYEYTRQLVSPFAGFLSGWMWIISNIFGGAAVSLGFAYYLSTTFPNLPINMTAAVLCLIFTILNFYGIHQSAILNNALVALKLAILGFFILYGLFFFKPENFVPFLPFNSNILFGAYFIFFAYGGFARATIIAEEVKDAKKNVPKAVIISLAVSTIFYLLVGVIAVGLVGATALSGVKNPLAAAIEVSGNNFAVQIVSLGGLVATASVLLTAILGVSRMIFSMSRRNDLPKKLSNIHKRYSTPFVSVWVVGVAMILMVLFVDLTSVVAVSTFALLFWYVFANYSAFKLKIEHRLYPRLVPILGLSTCLLLFFTVLFVAPFAWGTGLAFLAAGCLYYAVWKKRSKQRKLLRKELSLPA